MVEDTTATDALLALTISLDRDDQLQLEDFNSRILEAWCSRIAQCLGTTPDDFRKDMLPRRTQGAKTETHRDLRSVVVWNFVESFILSAPAGQASRGMAGAAIAMSLDRNIWRRHHRNCSAKESTLTKPSVAQLENRILSLLVATSQPLPSLSNGVINVSFKINGQTSKRNSMLQARSTHSWRLSKQPALTKQIARPVDHKVTQKVTPLHVSSSSGGMSSIHAMGDSVFYQHWISRLKTLMSRSLVDKVLGVARCFRKLQIPTLR